jgi:hypothetical protein
MAKSVKKLVDSSKVRDAVKLERSFAKTKVSNGTRLVHGADGRSLWIKRAKEIIEETLQDCGGVLNTSSMERSLIKRSATLTVEMERLERKFALAGEATVEDLDLYQRCCGNLRRIFEAIGLDRRFIEDTPTLSQYLRSLPPSNAGPEP